MASRRLSSSLLRPFLRRSPPELQAPASFRSFSVPSFCSRASPIAITKFPHGEAFSRFEFRIGLASMLGSSGLDSFQKAAVLVPPFARRLMSTETTSVGSSQDSSPVEPEVPPRIKFKRLDKTARHIMQACDVSILDKEAVEEVRGQREIPEIKPGYIVQLKVEVPENKRRISIIKGIVIARRNAGLNSTFRIRRLVAGVGVESLFPLVACAAVTSVFFVASIVSAAVSFHRLHREPPSSTSQAHVFFVSSVTFAAVASVTVTSTAVASAAVEFAAFASAAVASAAVTKYSPNIKEIKVLDKKKVRRAKLYYLREKMNALKN
ncbi:hypothetical protein Fmac_027183 [Flemingia macrophylla]|uniref:Ribosomal protein L19 n=1 Tax=Flemingia macrophylla TaxID=520843 RepID=A0ABD1LGZ5_9FABA